MEGYIQGSYPNHIDIDKIEDDMTDSLNVSCPSLLQNLFSSTNLHNELPQHTFACVCVCVYFSKTYKNLVVDNNPIMKLTVPFTSTAAKPTAPKK